MIVSKLRAAIRWWRSPSRRRSTVQTAGRATRFRGERMRMTSLRDLERETEFFRAVW